MNIKTNRDGTTEIRLSAWERKTLADAARVLRSLERHAGTTEGLGDKVDAAVRGLETTTTTLVNVDE